MTPWPASKRRINDAGERVLAWWTDPSRPDEELMADPALGAAAALVWAFRMGFQLPLNKVTMGMRSFVKSEDAPIVVSQRLKRLPTILGKLERLPNMNLARMQDIGGCRAIVPSRREVEGVIRRIRKRRWDVRRFDDYAARPKPTGYRAVHIVVMRDERLIEIQLRTPAQQAWAAFVDQTGARLGCHLKDGEGPAELLAYLTHAADAMALQEAHIPVDNEFEREFRDLQEAVRPYFPPS